MDANFKSRLLFLLLLLLLVFNILLLIGNYRIKSNNKKNNISGNIIPIQLNLNLYQDLKNRMLKAFKYEGFDFSHHSIFDSLQIDNEKLILRFTELTCNTCSDSLLFIISRNFSKQQLKNVVLLVDNTQQEYLYQFKRLNRINYPNIIEINNNQTVSPLDELNVPYFMVINKYKIGTMIYIPERDNPDETKDYLSIIQKRYFDSPDK